MSYHTEEELLADLNEPQREGVVNTEGPAMIIAGAGSGKTRVLTYRIACLIKFRNVDPFSIMALTFTNKAAREMQHRIETVAGTDARNIWMGTFHSVFARLLRAEAPHIGYPSNFTIYDTDDSKSLLKSIIKEQGMDDKLYKPAAIFNRISAAKNNLIGWQEYLKNPVFSEEDSVRMQPLLGKLYMLYVQRCFKADAMDFDDLLFNTNLLFREHPAVLNKYQQRFRYVLVDEFQDTNISQYLITKRLAAVRQNIAVVGDDAQSIYAFRGANIQNILNFEKDYPDLKIIKLEQNYRSTQNIVNAANSVIIKNKAQLHKNIWTSNEQGRPVEVIKAVSDNEEGRLVASAIFEQKMNHQYKNGHFAVLYRTNSQSRAMEEALRKMNIKYKVVGGLSFYQRREIKDLLGYLRFTVNQNDEQALRRIINLPKRGIGDSSIDKVIIAADEQGVSLWEIIENIQHFVGGRVGEAITVFVNMIRSFRITMSKSNAYDTAQLIAKNSGLLKELYEDKTIEGLNRYENVQELLNAISEFVHNPDTADSSLGAFLQEVSLLTDADDKNKEQEDAVTLMTIHMAKGLEFKNVFVVGMEEDLFPSQMMLSSRADLEEERRLFYVAITRAEKHLFLSYATSRYRFGRLKSCDPSRFLSEIAPEFLHMSHSSISHQVGSGVQGRHFGQNALISGFSSAGSPGQKNQRQGNFAKQTAYEPSADFKPGDTANIAVNNKVEHPKFGFGRVIRVETEGSNRKAVIDFESFGEKTLLLSFAKLKILE